MVSSTSNPLTDHRAAADPHHPPAAVELTNVTRVFGLSPGLVRASLRLAAGDVVLIQGPNGAGKSTLLRVIATALSPTYGSGSVFGFDLVGDREEIRRRTELIGHRTRLYEDLTAEENLRFWSRLYGVDAGGIPDALDRVGLSGTARERVRGFSQGMRQRVAVARALLRSPDLLLLDEPYAGLDAAAKEVVDHAVREAARGGRTVLLATHDAARVELASRVVTMAEGRIVGDALASGRRQW